MLPPLVVLAGCLAAVTVLLGAGAADIFRPAWAGAAAGVPGAALAAGAAAAGFAAGFGGRLMRIVSFLACGLGIEGVAPAAGAAEGVVGTDGVAGVGLVFKFSAILNKNPKSL